MRKGSSRAFSFFRGYFSPYNDVKGVEKGRKMDKKNVFSLLFASIACFGIGTVFGCTIQERHDSRGLREIQGRLEDMVYDLQTKNYVEVEEGAQ